MDETVQRYFHAMQRGPEGDAELAELFADDAVYVEPFSGGTHVGRDAIMRWIEGSRAQAPPDLRVRVERVEVVEQVVEAAWVCESPAFARPARGRDRFTVADGRIVRLESELTEQPEWKR
jgi:ketosteroid isomerase-like protein